MEIEDKVLDVQDLALRLHSLREQGRTVVLCHGVFDLLHIGHVRYFRQAKKHGDILVVTLTPDRFVDKGPGRPAFSEDLRAEFIASLSVVDFVAVNQWPTAEDTLRVLRPDFYAKGSEFKEVETDYTGKIGREVQVVNELDIKMVFTEDIVFSSSTLLNSYFSKLPPRVREYVKELRQEFDHAYMVGLAVRVKGLRVVVAGDAQGAAEVVRFASGLVDRVDLISSETPDKDAISARRGQEGLARDLDPAVSTFLETIPRPFAFLGLLGPEHDPRLIEATARRAWHSGLLLGKEAVSVPAGLPAYHYFCLAGRSPEHESLISRSNPRDAAIFMAEQGCRYRLAGDKWVEVPALAADGKYSPQALAAFFTASSLALAVEAPLAAAVLMGLAAANLLLESGDPPQSGKLQKYFTSLLK